MEIVTQDAPLVLAPASTSALLAQPQATYSKAVNASLAVAIASSVVLPNAQLATPDSF